MRIASRSITSALVALLSTAALADVPFQPLADFGKGGTPIDVNADGVIAGTLRSSDDSKYVPVIWQTPTSTPTVLPTTDEGGYALAINSSGQVAGVEFRSVGGGSVHAVLWENGEKFVLPDLGEGASANDINEAGVIAGTVMAADNRYLACRWVNRQLELLALPALTGEDEQVRSIARSINSAGVITGCVGGADGLMAVRWDADGVVSEVVSPGLETEGIAIDNIGSVLLTGYFDGGYSTAPARVQADGTLVMLPVPADRGFGARGNCMSRTGIVAGYSYGNDGDGNFIVQAVAWPDDQFTLLAMPAGMRYAFPYGVGNNGLVFGSATDGDTISVPGFWNLGSEASLVSANGSSGAPGQTVELVATSSRPSGKKNAAHSVSLRMNGVKMGQALTDAQGVARITLTIPADFTGSTMTVRVADENGASTLASIDVTPSCVAADLDCDGQVGGSDLAMLLLEFGNDGPADLDGSGVVDFGDVSILLLDWNG